MNISLVIMAAGIGSRFGKGIKQLEPLGPSGELIMDYSIYDAIEAGFNKVVFIIRKEMENYFREIIGDRISKRVEVAYAYQELSDLPEGFLPGERIKPWGTGQAVLACRGIVNEPFAVLNADDYYGKEAFRQIYRFLTNVREEEKFHFCMAGFRLKNTLSEHGGVTRGICKLNEHGKLCEVRETRNIEKINGKPALRTEDGVHYLDGDAFCSMNIWGLTPKFFSYLEKGFKEFLQNLSSDDIKTEYLLPIIIDGMIKSGQVDIEILETSDRWFGVTYQEDKEIVRKAFCELVENGIYSNNIK